MPDFMGVRIVDVEPMSDVFPASDADIARRSAELMDKLMIITDAYPGVAIKDLPWMERAVYNKVKRQLDKLVREHQRSVELFENWCNAGKPDLE